MAVEAKLNEVCCNVIRLSIFNKKFSYSVQASCSAFNHILFKVTFYSCPSLEYQGHNTLKHSLNVYEIVPDSPDYHSSKLNVG